MAPRTYPYAMLDEGAPSRLAQFVAPVVIIIVVLFVLLAAIHTSNNESSYLRSSGQASYWTASNEQFECLRAAFQKEVPRGSSVWLGNLSYDPSIGTVVVSGAMQSLAEMATLWAVPAPRSSARWAASINPGSECSSLALHVEKLR
jgi:hypothetical protein